LWLVAQDSTGGGNEQAGFDVMQPDPITMELSSRVELAAGKSPGCDGQLSVNIPNYFNIIGKRLSPRGYVVVRTTTSRLTALP
jgi:hypothetical protein